MGLGAGWCSRLRDQGFGHRDEGSRSKADYKRKDEKGLGFGGGNGNRKSACLDVLIILTVTMISLITVIIRDLWEKSIIGFM